MAYRNNLDDALAVVDRIQDSILTDSQPILTSSAQLPATSRAWGLLEIHQARSDTLERRLRQSIELSLGGFLDPDRIALQRVAIPRSLRNSLSGRDGSFLLRAMRSESILSSREVLFSPGVERTALSNALATRNSTVVFVEMCAPFLRREWASVRFFRFTTTRVPNPGIVRPLLASLYAVLASAFRIRVACTLVTPLLSDRTLISWALVMDRFDIASLSRM